jgi:glutathione synthase
MGLRIAIQMDHISTIDTSMDTTYALALEAQARGHDLWHYTPDMLSYNAGKVIATAQHLTVREDRTDYYTIGADTQLDLAEVDVILVRQDPPFDMNYITYTHLLEHLPHSTVVLNNPREIRNAPEKLFVLRYPDLTPPTMISRDRAAIRAFREEHQDIIIKPLYGAGGAGVFRIAPNDQNLNSLLDMFFSFSREPIIAQKFLPDVKAGDKRIILVDGEPVGAVNRVPSDGEIRSNFHAGGRAEGATFTAREREICRRIGPDLKERGLLFVGIDVIGGNLTEINVTSPSSVQEANACNNIRVDKLIIDSIEKAHARAIA